MSDKMPEKVYASKQWGGIVGFEPFAGAEKYRREDLPKEVDLVLIQMRVTAMMRFHDEKFAVSEVLEHLVALGVIKDKGV